MSNAPFSVSLVIPIYNNATTAPKLLDACYKIMKANCKQFEILLCNDSSSDDSGKVIERFSKKHRQVTVINHKNNKGIAATLQELYRRCSYEYTLLFSVDGGWEPKDIATLIKTAKHTKADIIIGKRTHKQYKWYRHVVSYCYNALPLLLFGVKTKDAGSIKLFKTKLFTDTTIESKSVFFEVEMLIKAKKKGYKLTSVPVSHKQHIHKSKSGVNIKSVKAAFVDLIKLRLSTI